MASISVSGEQGLLLSIIEVAAIDAKSKRRERRIDAAKYFAGAVYRRHLELLGLPTDWMPDGIDLERLQNEQEEQMKFESAAREKSRRKGDKGGN